MGTRFWRRVRIAPGLTLNLSKSGASLSMGGRGAHYTIGRRGRRATVGIPGTGLFYTTKLGAQRTPRARSNRSGSSHVPEAPAHDKLDLNFFERLVIPRSEEHFVDAVKAWIRGDKRKALRLAQQSTRGADGAFLAGLLAMDLRDDHLAEAQFEIAWSRRATLGALSSKYDVSVHAELPITDEVCARIAPDERGVLLALAELFQRRGDEVGALKMMRTLLAHEPGDPAVRLSIAELLVDAKSPTKKTLTEVIELAKDVQNDSTVHANLLFCKAQALRRLGLWAPARNELSKLLRKRADRSAELLQAARYERALVYEALKQKARARADLESLYADDPGYKDVARRIGLAPAR